MIVRGEDFLQGALERLEWGQTLEACQQGLPEEERELLALASRLRGAEWPERDPGIIDAHRKRLVKEYVKEINMQAQEHPRIRTFPDWRLLAALSAGVVVLAICGLLASAGAGLFIYSKNRAAAAPTGTAAIAAALQTPKPATQAIQATGEATVQNTQPSPQSPGEALLADLRGLVEVQQGQTWVAAQPGERLAATARLRTGALSGATLVFLDGSRATLGQYSEVTIDKLNANPGGKGREVALTQWSGESEHQVAPDTAGGSSYLVNTASSRGVAKGTRFHVRIVSRMTAWFVDEGAVDVTGKNTSVRVKAGKMTTVNAEKKPRPPMAFISGQGEVASTGETWVIAGQTFRTHRWTVVIGNPQVGDIVYYEGHLLPDGTRMADLIVLIRHNPANTFTLTGQVQAIAEKAWTVNGQTIAITGTTQIDAGIMVGDLVRVDGIILKDGALQASEIHKLEEQPGTPFDFTGVVQQVGANEWLISNVTVAVNADTKIDDGLEVGDLVRAQGWILKDGTWLASSITRVEDKASSFEITGILQSMNPWVVAGVGFETREWTQIDIGLKTGDLVHVEGIIQEDGTWVAFEIRRVGDTQVTILIGRVYSINPWIVSGFHLNVDQDTQIIGNITIGMLVRVEIQWLPDGSHKVLRIEPVSEFWWWWDLGCHELVVIVDGVDGHDLRLKGWPNLPLGEGFKIPKDLRPGAIILIQICFDKDGNVRIITIIIIFQPEPPPPPDDTGGMVTICHKPGKHEQTKIIPKSALGGHLGHGDTLGPCGGGGHDEDEDD